MARPAGALLLVLAACSASEPPASSPDAGTASGDGAVSGPGDGGALTDFSQLGPPPVAPAPYHRVDLSSAGGQLTVVRIAYLPAREGVGPPLPAHRGELLAVSLAGTELVEAVPIRFASAMIEEGTVEGGGRYSETSSVPATRTSIFLRADQGADAVEIIDRSGAVVLRAPLPPRLRIMDALSPELPYAVVLTEDADRALLPERLERRVMSIVDPSTADRAALLEAYRKVSPEARGAIHMVAFVTMENDGAKTLPNGSRVVTLGVAFGDAMILNATFLTRPALRDELISTFVHEGAHNFHFLIDDVSASGRSEPLATYLEGWPEAYRAAIQATVERHLLGDGLTRFWIDIHASAVAAQLSFSYLGDDWGIRATTDFSELSDPAPRALCQGRALCGRFAPTPRTSALVVEAHSRYGPFGWGGQVPPGWMPGAPLDYAYFQLGLVIAPGAPLVGVHRITQRTANSVMGGRIGPIANTLFADSPTYDVFLGSGPSGLLIISRADAERVEGVLAFMTLHYVAGAGDPRDGRLAQIVPLSTFRIDRPPGPDDPCCPR